MLLWHIKYLINLKRSIIALLATSLLRGFQSKIFAFLAYLRRTDQHSTDSFGWPSTAKYCQAWYSFQLCHSDKICIVFWHNCSIPLNIFKTIHIMKGAFIDSLGRDYYKIGTAADIQVILVHPWIGLDTVIFVLCAFYDIICHMSYDIYTSCLST